MTIELTGKPRLALYFKCTETNITKFATKVRRSLLHNIHCELHTTTSGIYSLF